MVGYNVAAIHSRSPRNKIGYVTSQKATNPVFRETLLKYLLHGVSLCNSQTREFLYSASKVTVPCGNARVIMYYRPYHTLTDLTCSILRCSSRSRSSLSLSRRSRSSLIRSRSMRSASSFSRSSRSRSILKSHHHNRMMLQAQTSGFWWLLMTLLRTCGDLFRDLKPRSFTIRLTRLTSAVLQ